MLDGGDAIGNIMEVAFKGTDAGDVLRVELAASSEILGIFVVVLRRGRGQLSWRWCRLRCREEVVGIRREPSRERGHRRQILLSNWDSTHMCGLVDQLYVGNGDSKSDGLEPRGDVGNPSGVDTMLVSCSFDVEVKHLFEVNGRGIADPLSHILLPRCTRVQLVGPSGPGEDLEVSWIEVKVLELETEEAALDIEIMPPEKPCGTWVITR